MPEISKWILNNFLNSDKTFTDIKSSTTIEKKLSEENSNKSEKIPSNSSASFRLRSVKKKVNSNNLIINNTNNLFEQSSYLKAKEDCGRDFLNDDNNDFEEPIFDISSKNLLYSNKELLKEKAFKILKSSIFELHNNEKGKKPYIFYDKIEYEDSEDFNINIEKIIFDINEIKKITINDKYNYLQNNFTLFLDLLEEIEDNLEKKFKYDYKFKVKLSFSMNPGKYYPKSIFNIDCFYNVEIPGKRPLIYKDENILRGISTGFIYLIQNINCEENEDLAYIGSNSNNNDDYYENFYN